MILIKNAKSFVYIKNLILCNGSSTAKFIKTSNVLYSNVIITQNSHREFRTSYVLPNKCSSKVETTVNAIKDKQKEKMEELKKKSASEQKRPQNKNIENLEKIQPKKSLKTRIWVECVHYYHGFRLLFIDIKISARLFARVLRGNKLSRRESNMLVRTTADLFRLIPFSVFIVVPFMEFALPFYLKYFPGMLPSTFQTVQDRDDKLKKSLQLKIEMAKFLQKTLDDMAVQLKRGKSDESQQFAKFFKNLKNSETNIKSEDIIKFAKQFEDEITLDSLNRDQLVALCRILEMNTIGTTRLLRYQMRMKLRSLAADDHEIRREGIKMLNLFELQSACKARGMRAYGLSKNKLRDQLTEWINLSHNEKIPPILLLLSQALHMPDDVKTVDKLTETIRVLPPSVGEQMKVVIDEREGSLDNKTKIIAIKDEERKIKEEREEEIYREEIDSSKDVDIIGNALSEICRKKKQLLVEKTTLTGLKKEIKDYVEDVEELQRVTKSEANELAVSPGSKILLGKVNSMITDLEQILADIQKQGKKGHTSEEYLDKLVHIDELVDAIKKTANTSKTTNLKSIKTILAQLDTDKDGLIEIEDVLKVFEIINRDNVKINAKQLYENIEIICKEKQESETKVKKNIDFHEELMKCKSTAKSEVKKFCLQNKETKIPTNKKENHKSS